MVQQISVQQISLPKAEPKEKVQPETASFKNALKKAENSLPSKEPKEMKDESGKADTQTSGEEALPAAKEEKLPEASPQNNIVSPLMLWLLMGNPASAEQNVQSSTDLLTATVPQVVSASSETAQTALTAIGSAAEKTGVVTLQQLLQQQTSPQTPPTVPAAQTANPLAAQQTIQQVQVQSPVQLLTPQQTETPVQPIVQETVLPQLAVQTADPLSASSKTEQKGNQAVQGIPALSADVPGTAAAMPVPVQTQQNNLGSALSGHTQDKPADTTGNTSEQHSDFAALFVSQNDSVSASTAAHASASSKLSAGTAAHLTEQIVKNVQAKNNSFRMELFPQDLGKVSVSLKMEQGLLVVDILADSPRTQSLLASGSGEIRSLLESAVGQPVQVTQPPQDAPAYYQQEQESSGQQQDEQQSQQHQEQETTEDFLSVLQQMKEQSSIL
ncbi:flagellar hook-length control protein FliK [Faecalispora jeddahensis]|uniref:flagellar hook-length control protein FliK n=1 Tax=Faecalispora jeddahensis TaxID=1414721 RepID=UPI00189810FF|nr:flagellar hook-length control protein FliK [Faecalispora jeddahensis]